MQVPACIFSLPKRACSPDRGMYLVTEGMPCRAALLFAVLYTSGLPTASTFLGSLEELGDMTSPP